MIRNGAGSLGAFLNVCRHRGNRLCRADDGNAASFICAYHGWTGVPNQREAYHGELDMRALACTDGRPGAASSGRLRALNIHVERIDGRTRAHEQAIALPAAETEVRTGLWEVDLTNQGPIGRVAADAILGWVSPPHAAPHVALGIDAHAICEAGRKVVREYAAPATCAIFYGKDADMRRATMRNATIDHV